MAVHHHRAFDGGLFIAGMKFENVGDELPTHEHTYDHFLLCASGGLSVMTPRGTEEMEGFQFTWVEKGVAHHLKATKPNTVALCLHACRHADGKPITPEEAKGMTMADVMRVTGAL